MSHFFEGKVFLITGASAGIGKSLAKEIVRENGKVILFARRQDRLKELALELGGTENAVFTAGNVTLQQDVEHAVQQGIQRFGKLDGVIANAGFAVAGALEALTVNDYKRQFDVNLIGVLNTIYAALPELKKSRGSLVIIGSVAGYVSTPESSAYSMSKFAIRGLAEAITPELRKDGITVTLISPGFIESEIRMVNNQGVFKPTAKDPISPWLIMPSDLAARKITEAISNQSRERILTLHGKIAVFLSLHFRWIVHFLFRFYSRSSVRK